ncbi:MAG: exopolysaccharide biosynthesis polyprenyl glycosylphosphotransferase [Chlamydiales bacterium]
MIQFQSSFKRWAPFLIGVELFLIFVAGHLMRWHLLMLFLGTLVIYLMTGATLFYSLLFEEITPLKMARKQTRRWGVLFLLANLFFILPLGKINLWLLLSGIFLFTFRSLFAATLYLFKRQGWNLRRLAILGTPASVEHIEQRLNALFWSGYRVITKEKIEIADLHPLLIERRIEEIWITLPLKEQSASVPILEQLRYSTVNIKLLPDFTNVVSLNLGVSSVGGSLAIHLQETPMQGVNRIVKWLEDKIFAFGILCLVSPIMILIALLVKLSSPGPIFYRQERVSWNNESFWMLKFRSMPVAVEACTGPVWAASTDGRTTWLGKWLRKTSLDELPQFINVLKGEMSIVGPRPERPFFIQQFKEQIPQYMQKHMVKAGITGLAQVRGYRGKSDLGRRIDYDLQYIRDWSLWLDLKIIFLTVIKGFVSKNAY